MKKGRILFCLTAMAAVFIVTWLFLDMFMETPPVTLGIPQIESARVTDSSGTVREADPGEAADNRDWHEGDTVELTFRLPEAEAMPELYNEDGFLSFSPCGASVTLWVDGQEQVRMDAAENPLGIMTGETHVPLPPEWAGKMARLAFRAYSADYIGPCLYYNSYDNDITYYASYAGMYDIPTGYFALTFLLVCAVFLLSVSTGRPDWTLVVLALVAGFTTVWQAGYGLGYYFLPEWFSVLFYYHTGWVTAIPLALTALYLFLNRKRSFWRYFGIAVLVSAAVGGVWLVILWLLDSSQIATLRITLEMMLEGFFPATWVFQYLVSVCCGIAMYTLIRSQVAIRSGARALAVRQEMLQDSYRSMERSVQETAMMRHDWKNRISGLHLLAEQGEWEKLKSSLEQMDVQLERLSPRMYSRNMAVNVILQNAAVRAQDAGVSFNASAPLPEDLGIDSADLCSLLINMLDNAIEAASRADGPEREIDVNLRLSQGFLAIRCENSYSNRISTDETGSPVTKKDGGNHGYGLAQMRLIAEKYGGILDVSWTSDRFTVQTALNLK